MPDLKVRRLELIRERHRKLIVKPKREFDFTFTDEWEEEADMWGEPEFLAPEGRAFEDDD